MPAVDPIAVARKVIALDDEGDCEGILNLAAPSTDAKITKASPSAAMRKLYLKLSLLIHPDRLGGRFKDATKAFQALVRAFETLSAPPLVEEVDSGRGKGKKGATEKKPMQISRSNEGCHRTQICCPRCKQPWNEGTLDGNPDYCYNFLMTGLKSYTCSTCLCEFGCMTAIHRCPFCRKAFEYSPDDYHKKVTCGNPRCMKPFGFHLYHVSDRAMKATKTAVKAELEARIRTMESKARRAARSKSRGSAAEAQQQEEESFMLGLLDVCPRCGEDFTCITDEAEQRQHLMECSDTKKQKAHQAQKRAKQQKAAASEELQHAQDAAQTHAAWQLLGAKDSQLWLLTDAQVREHAKAMGIESGGKDKDELISSIVAKNSEGDALLLEDASAQGKASTSSGKDGDNKNNANSSSSNSNSTAVVAVKNEGSKGALVVSKKRSREGGAEDIKETIPSDLHSYSHARLRSMCAAHGLLHKVAKTATREDMLNLLESKFYDNAA